jgi:hypothetical protein
MFAYLNENKMTAKTRRIISLTLMVIPSLVLIAGGVMKIIDAEPEQVMQFLNQAGFGLYIKVLGFTGLLIAALFLYPKTEKVGFLLAICYFSGALSLEIGAGAAPASAFFLVLSWASMFLRHKEMFVSAPQLPGKDLR